MSFTPPACPSSAGAAGCDLLYGLVTANYILDSSTGANTVGMPNEVTQYRLLPAPQIAGSVVATPAAFTTTANTAKEYVATVLDTTGSPMSGVTVSAAKSAGSSAVLSATSGVSAIDGTVAITVTDAVLEATTLTFTTSAGSATSTFTTSNPSAGAFTSTPVKALSATPFTGSQIGTGSTAPVGVEYTATSPAVRICFTFANGTPVDSSNAGITANVFASVTRTVKNASTSTPGSPTTPVLTQDQAANKGCYLVAHNAAGTEEQGQDAFTGYYNGDAQPGYTAGGMDVLVTPKTLYWGQLKLTGSSTMGVKGTSATVTFTAKTPDGTVFAGRKLNLAISSPGTSTLATQPAGTTALTATTATCLTDSNGACG